MYRGTRSISALILAAVMILAPTFSVVRAQQLPAQKDNEEWQEFRKQIGLNSTLINSFGWQLIHTYESKEQVDEVLKLLEVAFTAASQNNPKALEPIGGLTGFFKRFLALMDSDDDTVAAFSARVLAATTGKRYLKEIGLLLNKPNKKTDYPPRTIRGQAALVLSFLQASEFKPEIAKLLDSSNEYDRSGACYALGEFKATEYADRVASLLAKKDGDYYRDESPIESLVAMGAASKFKKEIAASLEEGFAPEVNKAAVYALAHLRSIEFALQIGNLLAKKYRRGDAAKGLAIMGAREYAPKIAQMLSAHDEPLDQCAALLALGILKAKNYAPQAAKLMRTKLKSKDSYVSHFAAESLVLMGEQRYAREIISILKVNKTGTYVDVGDFHPLVEQDVRQINNYLVTTLEQFKRGATPRGSARDSH